MLKYHVMPSGRPTRLSEKQRRRRGSGGGRGSVMRESKMPFLCGDVSGILLLAGLAHVIESAAWLVSPVPPPPFLFLALPSR